MDAQSRKNFTALNPAGARTDLRAARLSKGYSFEQLAIATGLTEAELREVEVGDSLDRRRLDRVRAALS